MMWDVWWVWLAAALVLAILEIVVPGFILLGFAIGAAVTGVLLAVGLAFSLAWLLVVFAVVSLLGWIVLRKFIGVRTGQQKVFDRDINEG